MEHLYDAGAGDEVAREFETCRSATNSPLPHRRRRGKTGLGTRGGYEGESPNASSPSSPHGAGSFFLPRRNPGKTNMNLSHVYAMVSKSSNGMPRQGSKDNPPIPLPKPKRGGKGEATAAARGGGAGGGGGEGGGGGRGDQSKNSPSSVSRPPEISIHLANKDSDIEGQLGSPPTHKANGTHRLKDEDTFSLQGIPSSEISHTLTEDGQLYAVVTSKKKKKSRRRTGSVDELMDEMSPAERERASVIFSEEGRGRGGGGSKEGGGVRWVKPFEDDKIEGKKKGPAKPPRNKPSKPTPYVHRAGSPLPLLSPASPSPVSTSPASSILPSPSTMAKEENVFAKRERVTTSGESVWQAVV